MELKQFERNLISNAVNSTSFGMELTGAAFEIMSSAIYEHKIIAVIREYICNAIDAHNFANKGKVPITVTLPNTINPAFIVADQGGGLDENDIRTVFAVYFKSTKAVNDFSIGGFGLGGKCGFAYTDSFTITSIFDGVKSVYCAFTGTTGIPDISLISRMASDESAGISVAIPVQSKDFTTFNREVSIICSMFETPPTIIGAAEIEYPNIYAEIADRGFATIPKSTSSSLYRNHNAYALVGGAIYPIPDECEADTTSAFQLVTKNESMIVPFGINEIRPAASRERIQIIGDVVNLIDSRITRLVKERMAIIQQKLNEQPSILKSLKLGLELYGESVLQSGVTIHGRDFYTSSLRPARLGRVFRRIKATSLSGKLESKTYRYNMTKKMVSKTPDFGSIARSSQPLHVFYCDPATKKTSFNSFTKRYIKENLVMGASYIVLTGENDIPVVLNEHTKKRISGYLDGNCVFMEFDEYAAKYRKVRQVSTHAATLHDRGTKTDSTIYCRVVSGFGKVAKVEHHTLDPEYDYVWMESPKDVRSSTLFGVERPVRGIIKTKANARKIEAAGIKSYDQLIDSIIEHCSDYPMYLALRGYLDLDDGVVEYADEDDHSLCKEIPECAAAAEPVMEQYRLLCAKYEDHSLPTAVTRALPALDHNPASDVIAPYKHLIKDPSVGELIRLRMFAEKHGYSAK